MSVGASPRFLPLDNDCSVADNTIVTSRALGGKDDDFQIDRIRDLLFDILRTDELECYLVEAHSGSSEALGALFTACRPALLRLAGRFLTGRLAAKVGAADLVQNAFLKAHKAFPGFPGTTMEDLGTWLRRIFINTGRNLRREYLVSQKRNLAGEVSLDDPRLALGVQASMRAEDSCPRAAASRREQLDLVHQRLRSLPLAQRRAAILRFWKNWPYEDIGRRLGCSAEAARKLCDRARPTLRGPEAEDD